MGWLDDPKVAPTATPPAGWWEKDPIVGPGAARAPVGVGESFQAGLQSSAMGLAWRGKLPDLMVKEHQSFWEGLSTGVGALAGDFLPMVAGAVAGGAAGTAAGTAVAPGIGTFAGGIAGAGAGMGFVPSVMRESLMAAYRSGEITTKEEWWNELRQAATRVLAETGLMAGTFGAIGVAGRVTGRVIAPLIGDQLAVPVAKAGAKTALLGGATATLESTQLATTILAFPAIPAALELRLPSLEEIGHSAIIIGGLHGANIAARRITNTFLRTGRTPAEQVADVQADPKVGEELSRPASEEVPRETDGRIEMPTIQESLFRETARLTELEEKAGGTVDRVVTDDFGAEVTIPGRPREFLTDAERAERIALKARIEVLEGMNKAVEPLAPAEPTFTPDQTADARTRAAQRVTELSGKTAALSDLERAERVFLTNAPPEALARHFKLEPTAPSRQAHDESAQRIYDDFYRQALEVEQARKDAGVQPFGDDNLRAAALLVRRNAETIAKSEGILPEDVFRERQPGWRDASQVEAAIAEAAIPPEAPRFAPPEVDLFGNPVVAPAAPRFAVEGMATVEVPLVNLILSKEVPQFKAAANAEGVIVPLGGKFDRTGVGPIQVWERMDGTLEVISGRHRLDLARRSGEETIPAQVHREAEGFDARQAAILDAELNIREEQGSVADYVQYFKDSGKTREAADELGLLARAKGRTGFAIARDASPDLVEAHRAGLLSDEAALSISSTAPGSARLQALGIAMVNEGKSIMIASNTMRAVDLMAAERMAAGTQGDLWNFDDSAMREASTMAKKASSQQRKISEQISAVSGASRRPELARKMGVDVADPEGIQKKIVELRQEQYLWDNWPLHPELVARLRGDLLKQPALDRPQYELTADGPTLRTRNISISDPSFEYTGNGIDIHRHAIRNAEGKQIGEMYLGWRGDQIVDVLNIAAEQQRTGTGEKAIRAILEHNEPTTTLNILYVQPESRAFWEKMGATLTTGEGHEHGQITRGSYERNRPALGIGPVVGTGEGTPRLPSDVAGKDGGRTEGPAAGEKGETGDPNVLKQEYFELKPETPAELKARDEEAAAQARRKLAQEAAAERAAKGRPVTVDEPDLFNTQGTLFQEHRASYNVAERLITTLEGSDKSSVLHELGHHFLENLKYYAERPGASTRTKAMWETARQEFAIGAEGPIGTAAHEQMARTWERYLGEGEAPSTGLRGVFEQFKTWMLEIYNDLRNIPGVRINAGVRALFDRMLATDEEIAAARELNVPRAYVAEAKANEARKIVPGFKAEQISMEPFADELPRGPGAAPDTSHVNYAYINSPMDVKLTMQRMAEIDQANIQAQRGGTEGVKSWAEANAEQARYVNDILGGTEDTLRVLSPRDPNAPGPDVRLGILKKLAVGAAKDSARLRDVVLEAGHDATVRQQLEYMGSIERARMIQAEFLGERASVARALNALKDSTEGSGEIGRMLDAIGYGEEAGRTLYQEARTPAQEQAFLKGKLDEILLNYRGKTVLDIAKLHKEVGTLKGTYTMAKKLEKATTWEMVVEAWKAGLLSGPVTHTTNLFGTGAFQAMRAPVDALAAVIGIARGASPGMGESDRASMSEAVARLTGMLGGVQDGVKVAVATFKLDDPTGKTESHRTAIPGRAGEVIRIPLRMMGAEDALVSTMYRRGETGTLAIRKAFDEQLNPGTREFAERVDFLKDHPTPEMEAAATEAATRMTFNMPLGEKGVALQLFVAKWNLQWMIPFIRTPINITKEVARMSPFAPLVGEWRADIAKGGVARDRAIAEATLGAGIMALTMAYTFSGQISGSGSPDPGENRGKAGVWQPGSILIGDTWYDMSRIQPTGTLMRLSADLAEAWDHMTEEEKDKVPKMLARAFANAVTSQTFLQGVTSVINAMSDPTRFGPKFMQQFAASMVPNIIGQPTTMADPVVREVNSMLDAIQARIPGFRQELLPQRDWLGEPVQTKERLGVILPVREQKVSDDKVRLEAARLDISMAAAPKKTHIGKGTGKLGDVELTPEERDTFEKVGGEMAHRILDNIVQSPGYDQIPDLVKRRIFSRVLSASHQVAAAAALPMDKRIAYIQSISEKIAAELEPQ